MMGPFESARRWMLTEDPRDYRGAGGEIDRTRLAENTADALHLYSDAPNAEEGTIPEWVFELAHDVATEWER